MPILLLIRHGENDYVKSRRLAGRTPGIHLNERGQKQVAELAAALAKVPLAALYSSPLERCLETAVPIARPRGIEVQVTDGLLETNIGEWQGAEIKKLSKLPEWKLVQGAPSRFRFPGGDSFQEEQTRLVAELERITHRHKPQDIIALVFHADPIKMVLAYYLGMPLDYFQRLGCDTGSVSVLLLGDSGAMLHQMNMRPPFNLPEPAKKRGRTRQV